MIVDLLTRILYQETDGRGSTHSRGVPVPGLNHVMAVVGEAESSARSYHPRIPDSAYVLSGSRGRVGSWLVSCPAKRVVSTASNFT